MTQKWRKCDGADAADADRGRVTRKEAANRDQAESGDVDQLISEDTRKEHLEEGLEEAWLS